MLDFLKVGGAIVTSTIFFKSLSFCAPISNPRTSSTPFTNILTSNSPLNSKYDGIGWPFDMIGARGALVYCAETLVRGDHKGNIVPWLVESFKIADDKKFISFNIRKGINFHDNSKLNAETIKWNLDNCIKAGQKPNWDSVEVIDEYNIQVYFTKWLNTLPSSFGDTAVLAPFLVSKQSFEIMGLIMRANPVTTGQYKFVCNQNN